MTDRNASLERLNKFSLTRSRARLLSTIGAIHIGPKQDTLDFARSAGAGPQYLSARTGQPDVLAGAAGWMLAKSITQQRSVDLPPTPIAAGTLLRKARNLACSTGIAIIGKRR